MDPQGGGGGGVALLAEGVDRNAALSLLDAPTVVALLAEGVDRNTITTASRRHTMTSPSSRRAWIEISAPELRRPC